MNEPTVYRDFNGTELPTTAAGIPCCPQCLEADKVRFLIGAPWCERCTAFVETLAPPPGKYVPMFL